MKQIFLFVSIFLWGTTFAQNSFVGTTVSIPESDRQVIFQEIRAFDVFTFPVADLNRFVKKTGGNGTTSIQLKFGNQYDWPMTIQENDRE